MWNLIVTVAVPVAISSYYIYQLAYAKNQPPWVWLLVNFFIPFIPIAGLMIIKPPKPEMTWAKSLMEEASYSTPMAVRLDPQKSRNAVNGWIILTNYGITWIQTQRNPDEPPRSIQWGFENLNLEAKNIYRDGLISLVLMPSPNPDTDPVALVSGTSFRSARIVATAAILSRKN